MTLIDTFDLPRAMHDFNMRGAGLPARRFLPVPIERLEPPASAPLPSYPSGRVMRRFDL
jgi:hypothetical protein